LSKIVVTTMQAVSGAGYPGVAFDGHFRDNVVPYIGSEEEKMEAETLKAAGKLEGHTVTALAARISASCNRVPVVERNTPESVSLKPGQPSWGRAGYRAKYVPWRRGAEFPGGRLAGNNKLPVPLPSSPIEWHLADSIDARSHGRTAIAGKGMDGDRGPVCGPCGVLLDWEVFNPCLSHQTRISRGAGRRRTIP